MLAQLGLSPDSETVYQAMVKNPHASAKELAAELGWPTERVTGALDGLGRLSLIRPSEDGPGRRLVSPEVALGRLLSQQEAELLRQQQRFVASRLAVARLVTEYGESRSPASHEDARRLEGVDAIHSCIEELTHACETEIAVFSPGSTPATRYLKALTPLHIDALDRGVSVFHICLESIRNSTSALARVRGLAGRGGQVRTVPHLPTPLAIYDRRAALVPVDPEASEPTAVLLHCTGTVAALQALFDQTWTHATPLHADQRRDEDGLSGQERAVLELLAQGHTDEVVARKLGVSVRTSRRITADVMARLGARSRFQAGALAISRGWISDLL